jgi:hypothetical protein
MTCRPFSHTDAKGRTMTGFVCGRGQSLKRCDCGRPHTKLCDYALRGKKLGKTCDKALCDRCAVKHGDVQRIDDARGQTDTVDYCQAHARIAAAEGARR